MDRLVAALWGDLAPPGAAATVRTYVSRLRRALAVCGGAQVITSVGGGYALPAAAGPSDLTTFERLLRSARDAGAAGDPEAEADTLSAALALWQGTPLAGVRAEYAEHERMRLGQRRLTAVEELAAAQLKAGRPAEAAARLASVAVEEPLREQTRVLLMLALYRTGRQAEALGVYQEVRRLLADELGLEPGPQLRRMQRRILSSDPSLEGPHRPRPPAAAHPPGPRPPTAHPPADRPAAPGQGAAAGYAPAVSQPPAVGQPLVAGYASAAGHVPAPAQPPAAGFAPAGGQAADPGCTPAATQPPAAGYAPAGGQPPPPGYAPAAGFAPAPMRVPAAGQAPPADPPAAAARVPVTAAAVTAIAPPVPPMQLPPDLVQFTGRADLVRWIAAELSPAEPAQAGAFVPVVGLTGTPGVGKTALAVHVGHAVAADFPDGQFFVDMGPCAGDTAAPPVTPADVLACLLRGMGVPDERVPAAGAERAALWRSVTTGRRLLLVLDGMASAEHVQAVLPGTAGPAVLVTARRRLFGPAHARWVKVEALPEDDALALLGTLAGAARIAGELHAARRLVDLTAGLPDVLHAMGARLASQPWWSLATAHERLSRRRYAMEPEPAECAVLAARYGSALRALEPQQARALRLLALPEGPDLTCRAAAAVLGLPVQEAEALLESLADVHLIEADAGDRYRFLYPVQVYARSRALLDEGRAACDAALARASAFHAPAEGGARRSPQR